MFPVYGLAEASVAVSFPELQSGLSAVHVDRTRIVQVLQNLLENAVKFMGEQAQPRIVIGQRGWEGDMPILYVQDNASREEDDRALRAGSTRTASASGTGHGTQDAPTVPGEDAPAGASPPADGSAPVDSNAPHPIPD